MPETVQDFDRRRGDLLQFQEPAHQLMTEEQKELPVIGRGQGAESSMAEAIRRAVLRLHDTLFGVPA